jgi:hypothetical protein
VIFKRAIWKAAGFGREILEPRRRGLRLRDSA